MALYLWSDTHFTHDQDLLAREFVHWLQHQVRPGDTVILLGDIFDVFVGSHSYFRRRFTQVFRALEQLQQNQIHFVEGNHDFNLQESFRHCPHVRIYPEELRLEWEGAQLYLAHGDLVGASLKYLRVRSCLRNRWFQRLVRLVPGKLAQCIGERWSQMSRKHSTEGQLCQAPLLQQRYLQFAQGQWMQGYQVVAMGHAHALHSVRELRGAVWYQYINVGFARRDRSYLRWESSSQSLVRETIPTLSLYPQSGA